MHSSKDIQQNRPNIPLCAADLYMILWLSSKLWSSEPSKIVSEYDQELPQSQNACKPMARRGRATQQARDTRKTQLSRATSSLFTIKTIAKLERT